MNKYKFMDFVPYCNNKALCSGLSMKSGCSLILIRSALLSVFVLLFFLCGCYPLKEYGSSDKGFVGVLFKNQFGEGKIIHDYFITANNDIINVGDYSKRVSAIMGLPDKDKQSLSGYRIWEYNNPGVAFYIDNDRVKYIYFYGNKRHRKTETE